MSIWKGAILKKFFKSGKNWIIVMACISFLIFLIEGDSTPSGKVFLHFSIELFGAIIVFLLLEKNIERVLELQKSKIKEVDQFPIEDFVKKIRSSKRIRMLDFSLISLIFRDEEKYRNEFLSALVFAINRGASVQILLVRPCADASLKRGIELSSTIGRRELMHFVDTSFRKIVETAMDNEKIELKFLDGHPRCAFYQADGVIHLGFHSRKSLSASEPHLQIDADSEAGIFFEGIFDELWVGAPDDIKIDNGLMGQWLEGFKSGLNSGRIL